MCIGVASSKVLKTSKISELIALGNQMHRSIMKMDYSLCSRNINWNWWKLAGITSSHFMFDSARLTGLMMELEFLPLKKQLKSVASIQSLRFTMKKAITKNKIHKPEIHYFEHIICIESWRNSEQNHVLQIIKSPKIIEICIFSWLLFSWKTQAISSCFTNARITYLVQLFWWCEKLLDIFNVNSASTNTLKFCKTKIANFIRFATFCQREHQINFKFE